MMTEAEIPRLLPVLAKVVENHLVHWAFKIINSKCMKPLSTSTSSASTTGLVGATICSGWLK